MKKFGIVALVLLTLILPVFGNGTREEGIAYSTETPVKVLALKGPTSMGMVGLMEKADKVRWSTMTIRSPSPERWTK